jgi:hypothetical protein
VLKKPHIQRKLLAMADEFLLQYLHCRFANKLVFTSRLFSMGHSLELYTKSALLNHREYSELTTHSTGDFLEELDSRLAVRDEVAQAGQKLFAGNIKNFDLGLYETYKEELEVYLAVEHLIDLKYMITKKGGLLFPVTISTVPFNQHFLATVKTVRGLTPSDDRTNEAMKQKLALLKLQPGDCDVL